MTNDDPPFSAGGTVDEAESSGRAAPDGAEPPAWCNTGELRLAWHGARAAAGREMVSMLDAAVADMEQAARTRLQPVPLTFISATALEVADLEERDRRWRYLVDMRPKLAPRVFRLDWISPEPVADTFCSFDDFQDQLRSRMIWDSRATREGSYGE